LREWSGLPLENWLAHVRAVYRAHQEELDAAPNEEARWRRLCEMNVMAQVQAVREAEGSDPRPLSYGCRRATSS
jgi:carbonic anhydrase